VVKYVHELRVGLTFVNPLDDKTDAPAVTLRIVLDGVHRSKEHFFRSLNSFRDNIQPSGCRDACLSAFDLADCHRAGCKHLKRSHNTILSQLNREAVPARSPGLPRSDYPGKRGNKGFNPVGVVPAATALAATPSGLDFDSRLFPG
jgi:hypothetical protein